VQHVVGRGAAGVRRDGAPGLRRRAGHGPWAMSAGAEVGGGRDPVGSRGCCAVLSRLLRDSRPAARAPGVRRCHRPRRVASLPALVVSASAAVAPVLWLRWR
jgi:hypothetical protein